MSISSCTCSEDCRVFSSVAYVALANVTLIVTNVLALYGSINASLTATINVAALGSFALITLAYWHRDKYPDNHDHTIYMSTIIVLSILIGLSALGFFGFFNAKQVAYSALPLASLVGLLSLGVICVPIYDYCRRG